VSTPYYHSPSHERASVPKRRVTNYRKDQRRKHHHGVVTVTHSDNERFERFDIDREGAEKIAARQKKSPVVMKTRIRQLS
jgi:hypothetical protein